MLIIGVESICFCAICTFIFHFHKISCTAHAHIYHYDINIKTKWTNCYFVHLFRLSGIFYIVSPKLNSSQVHASKSRVCVHIPPSPGVSSTTINQKSRKISASTLAYKWHKYTSLFEPSARRDYLSLVSFIRIFNSFFFYLPTSYNHRHD